MRLEQWMALAAQAPLATLAAQHMDAERLAQGLEGDYEIGRASCRERV